MSEPSRPLAVVFFATEAGNESVREWLLGLPKDERKAKPLVDSLGDGLWEIRTRLTNRIARTLFIVVENEIILLHGFIKKTQQTPKPELDLARKRQRQYRHAQD
jgi:phage-related protein